jgi:hypothetical protein
MAIDRGPWNALVDDDGSNLIGSIWNKAAIKTVLLDPIDTMGLPYQAITDTQTGTIANWSPAGFATRNTLIYWTGNADATINALLTGVNGQVLIVKNQSPNGAVMRVPYGAAAGAGFSPFWNMATGAPTPIALGGFAQYLFYSGIWIMCGHEQGAWITQPYSAADYSGSGAMTWTVSAGNVVANRYRLTGRTLQQSVAINNTSTGGSPANTLRIRIAGGFVGGGSYDATLVALGAIDHPGAFIRTSASYAWLDLYTSLTGANWAIGTVHMSVSIAFEVT